MAARRAARAVPSSPGGLRGARADDGALVFSEAVDDRAHQPRRGRVVVRALTGGAENTRTLPFDLVRDHPGAKHVTPESIALRHDQRVDTASA